MEQRWQRYIITENFYSSANLFKKGDKSFAFINANSLNSSGDLRKNYLPTSVADPDLQLRRGPAFKGLTMNVEFCEDNSGTSRYFRKNK